MSEKAKLMMEKLKISYDERLDASDVSNNGQNCITALPVYIVNYK